MSEREEVYADLRAFYHAEYGYKAVTVRELIAFLQKLRPDDWICTETNCDTGNLVVLRGFPSFPIGFVEIERYKPEALPEHVKPLKSEVFGGDGEIEP